MRTRYAALLALLVGLAACAPPPDELYNRGQQLEIEGRYEEAADYYIRALQGNPEMQKARGRLHVAGGLLLGRHLARADAASTPPEAADAFLAAEDLMARTAAVGVLLDQAPTGFEESLAAALDDAVEFLIARGADALDAGAFPDALAHFERARRYSPDGEQEEALGAFTYDAHLAWAEAELAAGRYRVAYDRAEAARPYAGGDRTPAEIDGLQVEALDRGSVYAAVFPVEDEDGRSTSEVPRGFVADLDLLLYDEHWAAPPLFVRTADPAELRRLLRRRYNTDDRLLYPHRTAELARDLLAEFGVAATLTRYDRQAEEADRDTLTAPLRYGDGTGRYVRLRDRVTHRAEVGYAVVDAAGARAVCEGTAEAAGEGDVRYGEQVGRGDLRLPREDRDLFNEAAQDEAERAIARRLQDRLADDLARRVYDCLLRQVR